MSNEIKLPPPPEHGEYITIWERILEWDSERKAWAKALALSGKVDDEITATLQAYATDAIEQDRASAPPDGSWRQAIDEALIACALDCTSSRDDPKAALSKLIDWHVQVALDPVVSSAAQAFIDADRAQRGEPVAWRAWFDKDSGARWLFSLWPDEENKGLEVDWQPLYTAPQPERKPMTDMEIQEAWNDHYLEHDMNEFDYYRMGQSDAERHHGIKP